MKKMLLAGGAAFLVLPLLLMGMVAMIVPGASTSVAGGAANVTQTADCTPTTDDSGSSDEGGEKVGVTEIAVKLAKALADAGYSKASAAGVLGNVQAESGFNPALGEKGGAGYGLAQWTPRSKIRAWFDSHGLNGVPDSDADGQIRMLVETVESSFNDHYYSTVTNIDKKKTLLETWRTAPDARTAAIAYMAGWERPNWGLRHEDTRVDAANQFYSSKELGEITWKAKDGEAPGGAPSDGGSTGSDGSVQQAACDSSDSNGEQTDGAKGKVGQYMAEAHKMADNEGIGYSQSRRRLNPDVDCSSFVYYALVNSGAFKIGDNKSPFVTWTMGTQLESVGFKKVGGAGMNPKDMMAGDILVNTTTHTEIFTKIDDKGTPHSIGAHSDRGHPADGDQDHTEVSEGYMYKKFDSVYRFTGE